MQDGDTGAGDEGPRPAERIALHANDGQSQRTRLWVGVAVTLLVAAGFGAIAGLIGGRGVGLVTAAVIAVPLMSVVLCRLRRQLWLEGHTLILRRCGTRRISLIEARRIDILVTAMRGVRSVALLINAGNRRDSARIDLAVYAGERGWELGALALRRVADALINNTEANGMVFAELLVAQLRSEARAAPASQRPLHRLAAGAQPGKIAQRYPMETVSKFVSSLE